MKLKGTDIDNTRYQYAALTMKTCQWLITKPTQAARKQWC